MTMEISAILRRAVQVAPDTTATIHLERQQTWRSFLERVQKLAGALQALGCNQMTVLQSYLSIQTDTSSISLRLFGQEPR